MDKLFKNITLEEFTVDCDKIINQLFEYEVADKQNKTFYSSAKKDIHDIIRDSCGNVNTMSNILHEAGYEEEKIKYFISKVDKIKNELLYQIIIDHNSRKGEALSTFDWAVKFICGTSELKTLRYPVLQLALTTYTNSAQKQRFYEMDKNMVARLIHMIENYEMIK